MLIKFPTLSSNSTFDNIGSYQINNATLTLYTASGGSGTETIKAYQYHGTWNESTVTWNDLAFLTPPILVDTTTVSSSSLSATSFDITQAVKNWASSDQYYVTPNNGIVLMNSNESDPDECRDFLSTEYASSHSGTGMPRLEIVYTSITRVYASVPTNTIEIGETITISAYVIIDGVKYYNSGTLLSFYFYDFDSESMSNSLVSPDGSLRLTSSVSGHITGLSTGSAMIVVACNSDPIMIDTVRITVVNKRVHCDDIGPFTIYNNNTENRAVNIDAYTISDVGIKYDDDAGITYSIYERKGTNLESVSVDASGKVSADTNSSCESICNDGYIAHPTGSVTVRAAIPGHAIYIKVNFVCYNMDNSHPGCAQIPEEEARYIRINYPEYNSSSGSSLDKDTLPSVYEAAYNQLCKPAEASEPIDLNFEEAEITAVQGGPHAFFQLLRASKIVVIQTHGNASSFVVNEQYRSISVTTEDILNLHQGYFSNCELIICLFCQSADSDYDYSNKNSPDNDPNQMSIIEAFADRGAQCVIGFEGSASFEETQNFMNHFAAVTTNCTYSAALKFVPNTEQCDTSFNNACMVALEYFEGAGNNLSSVHNNYQVFDGRQLTKTDYKINGETRIVMIKNNISNLTE